MSATAVSEKLYELTELRGIIDRALEATEGELTDDIAAALDAWDERFTDKAESIALLICSEEADAEKIKAEEEKLAARRKAKLNRCKWLEGYLLRNMQASGKDKVNGVLKTISLRKSQAVAEVVPTTQDDLRRLRDSWPSLVRHVPESFAWEKDEIKAEKKNGTLPEDVARRVAVVTNLSLQIR